MDLSKEEEIKLLALGASDVLQRGVMNKLIKKGVTELPDDINGLWDVLEDIAFTYNPFKPNVTYNWMMGRDFYTNDDKVKEILRKVQHNDQLDALKDYVDGINVAESIAKLKDAFEKTVEKNADWEASQEITRQKNRELKAKKAQERIDRDRRSMESVISTSEKMKLDKLIDKLGDGVVREIHSSAYDLAAKMTDGKIDPESVTSQYGDFIEKLYKKTFGNTNESVNFQKYFNYITKKKK